MNLCLNNWHDKGDQCGRTVWWTHPCRVHVYTLERRAFLEWAAITPEENRVTQRRYPMGTTHLRHTAEPKFTKSSTPPTAAHSAIPAGELLGTSTAGVWVHSTPLMLTELAMGELILRCFTCCSQPPPNSSLFPEVVLNEIGSDCKGVLKKQDRERVPRDPPRNFQRGCDRGPPPTPNSWALPPLSLSPLLTSPTEQAIANPQNSCGASLH